MNFDDTPQEASFRAEARAWLDANKPADLEAILAQNVKDSLEQRKAWQKKKADAGWACIDWPKDVGGRGASLMEQVIWTQEEGPLTHLTRFMIVGLKLASAALRKHGTDSQKEQLLPGIVNGDEIWCQLFSEPAAGSDLAGIRTHAKRDGDDWVINGQKIWTSYAHVANKGILVARTDPGLPKHKGLTYFYVDMDSPGIDIRGIKQISGDSTFNEVFLTDVRIPDSQRIGEVGDGWKVVLTTLMSERSAVGDSFRSNFPEMYGSLEKLTIDGEPLLNDPAVQDHLADFYCNYLGMRSTNLRLLSALSKGRSPGPEASIGKLVMASQRQEEASFVLDLQERAGLVTDQKYAMDDGFFQHGFFRFAANRIEGGTDEVLRNIIAERILGLPAENRQDKDVPFNEIPGGRP